tara:strand:- start:803 stop:1132 length:330 start_codon:yes stop_codon:yes gene_type:complete
MRQILLMIGLVALVGCGKKEPGQPTMPKSEITKSEPTKAKATAGIKLWEFSPGNATISTAIGSDSTVYVEATDNKLYAVNGKTVPSGVQVVALGKGMFSATVFQGGSGK